MLVATPALLGRRGGAAALVLAVAVLIGVPGCSGHLSDGDSSATTTSTAATAPVRSGREDYVRAVVAGLGPTFAKGGATDDEVACIAERWVDVIGPGTFASKGIEADQVASPSFSYATLGLTDPQAEELLDAFDPCGLDLVTFTLDALAPLVDDEQFACITSKVTPEQGRALGRSLLRGGADADAAIDAISDIAAGCGIDLS